MHLPFCSVSPSDTCSRQTRGWFSAVVESCCFYTAVKRKACFLLSCYYFCISFLNLSWFFNRISAFDVLKSSLLIFIPSASCHTVSFLAHFVLLYRPYQIGLISACLTVFSGFQNHWFAFITYFTLPFSHYTSGFNFYSVTMVVPLQPFLCCYRLAF